MQPHCRTLNEQRGSSADAPRRLVGHLDVGRFVCSPFAESFDGTARTSIPEEGRCPDQAGAQAVALRGCFL